MIYFRIIIFIASLLLPSLALAETTTYNYDSAGRLTTADYGEAGKITYTYDNNGNRLKRVVTAGQPPVPGSPTGIKATSGVFTDRVRVTFNTVPGATVYRVFRCLSAGQTCGTPIGFPKTGIFDDTRGVPGTVYYYRIRACTSTDCGKFSAASTGFTSVALAKPTGVKATDGSFSDRVRVTFDVVAGASVYRLFRCLSAGQTCGTPIGFPKTGTFDDTKGVPGTVYFYRVRACSSTSCGKFSAANTGFSSTVLAKPTGIRATDGTFADKVRVTFSTVAGASVYRVFRCLSAGQTCGTPIGFPKSGVFDDTRGDSGTVYYYRVRACTVTTCSLFSAANTGHRGSTPSNEPGQTIESGQADFATEAVRIPSLGVYGLIFLSLGVILLAFFARKFGKRTQML